MGFHVHMDEGELKPYDSALFGRLMSYVTPYKTRIVLACAAMFGASASQLVGPYLIKVALDNYIAAKDVDGLLRIGVLYVAAQALNWFFQYWQTYLMTWAGQRAIYQIRAELFAHLQELSFRFFDSRPAGVIMSRVTNDVNAMDELISEGFVHVVNDLVTLVGIIAIMAYMDARLALVALVTLPVLAWASVAFRKRSRIAYDDVRQKIAAVYANLQESISGVRVTQAFVREKENAGRFDKINEENYGANVRAVLLFSVFAPSIEAVGALGAALVVWYGGARIIGGYMTVGVLVAFISYLARFFQPIQDLSHIYDMLQSTMSACEKIFGIMDEVPEIRDREDAVPLGKISGRVVYDRVTFGYTPGAPVLFDINFVAEPGQRIALVGATGAGKSSIANLLGRFYDPTDGSVLVDGRDVRSVTVRSLRDQMGIVLQDTFLFSGTVRDNIRYGRQDATEEEILLAARSVGAHEFIEKMELGYDTPVHERGSRLSIGQRQLIAFARAVLKDPKILILDEATSSVDAYTELVIQKALERLLLGRTSLIIAHRLSTIRSADLILVLDQGRIVERGQHKDLLEKRGVYAKLYEMQFKYQDPAAD
jgi:ATP-binding cassette, subfamily B, multidrug efflux pump